MAKDSLKVEVDMTQVYQAIETTKELLMLVDEAESKLDALITRLGGTR